MSYTGCSFGFATAIATAEGLPLVAQCRRYLTICNLGILNVALTRNIDSLRLCSLGTGQLTMCSIIKDSLSLCFVSWSWRSPLWLYKCWVGYMQEGSRTGPDGDSFHDLVDVCELRRLGILAARLEKVPIIVNTWYLQATTCRCIRYALSISCAQGRPRFPLKTYFSS
jgi:hypothetical protein